MPITGQQVHDALWKAIEARATPDAAHDLQSESVLREAFRTLGSSSRLSPDEECAVLTAFYDLHRTGVLAWGFNQSNVTPPWMHLTSLGRRILENTSRDPMRRDGFLALLRPDVQTLSAVAWFYIEEAVDTLRAGLFRASAVMTGVATEALLLAVAEALRNRLVAVGRAVPAGLTSWKAKTLRDTIEAEVGAQLKATDPKLHEAFVGHWKPRTETIRAARNDAGHPSKPEAVTGEDAHASLLLLPGFVSLARDLVAWAAAHYR